MLQCLQSCATRWCRGEENDCIRRGRVASRYFRQVLAAEIEQGRVQLRVRTK